MHAQLTSQWKDKLQEGDCSDFQTMDISRGLANTTLDIIGEGKVPVPLLDKAKESKLMGLLNSCLRLPLRFS